MKVWMIKRMWIEDPRYIFRYRELDDDFVIQVFDGDTLVMEGTLEPEEVEDLKNLFEEMLSKCIQMRGGV